jgi:hypothetical protein
MNHDPSLTRRGFLRTAGGVAATLAVGQVKWPQLRGAAAAAVKPPAPSWVDKPMRWAQLTLVEDDPGQFQTLTRLFPGRACRIAVGCLASSKQAFATTIEA